MWLYRSTSDAATDGEVVWSWRLDAGVNSVTMLAHRTEDGDKKARSPERARRKPLKPLAQGRPGRSGGPVVTNSYAFHFCIRGCGCIRRPAFPAPSRGEPFRQNSGVSRREDAESCLRGSGQRLAKTEPSSLAPISSALPGEKPWHVKPANIRRRPLPTSSA